MVHAHLQWLSKAQNSFKLQLKLRVEVSSTSKRSIEQTICKKPTLETGAAVSVWTFCHQQSLSFEDAGDS